MLSIDEIKNLVVYCAETGRITHINNKPRKDTVKSDRKRRYIKLNKRQYLVHRVAWMVSHGPIPDDMEIDHINGDESDNRVSNLRLASKSMNQQNKRNPRKDSSSGLLGVGWFDAAKKWRAQITVNKKTIYLGCFTEKEDAHNAYLAAKRQLHIGCTI